MNNTPNKYNIPNISGNANKDIDIYLEKLNNAGITIELFEAYDDCIHIFYDKKLPKIRGILKKYFNVSTEEGRADGLCCIENAGEPDEYVSIDTNKNMRIYQISLKNSDKIVDNSFTY
jgi:hypothetical protein